ncbi:hypothetical protein OROHE_003581 [Orobanche hederae]
MNGIQIIKRGWDKPVEIPADISHLEFKLTDYERIHPIGCGGSGSTYMVKRISDGKSYAMKRIHKYDSWNFHTRSTNDMKLVTTLNHPNIIKCRGICSDNFDFYYLYDAMYPLAFSSLFKDERQLAAIAFQLLKALYYLRKEKNFVFRHLTPGSILYDQRKHLVKISDILTIKDQHLTPLEDGGTGFLRVHEKYMSPEHFSQDVRGEVSDHLCKSDIWSLGLCLLELYLGEYPFKAHGSDIFGLYHHIELTYGLNSVDHNVWPPKPPADAPPLFSDFISKCLKLHVSERADIEELATHELFTNYGFDFSRYKRMLSVISQKPRSSDDNENDYGAKDSRSSDDSNHDPVAACSSDDCKDEDDLVLSGVAQTCDDNVNEDDKVIFEESRTSYASKDETDLMLPEIARDNSASSQDGGDEEPKRKKLRWR